MVEFGIINTNCWQESSPNINNKTFINTDIPLLMHIIESGWPNMYSVLIEDGIVGKPRLEFLTEEQIETKYNINIKQKKT